MACVAQRLTILGAAMLLGACAIIPKSTGPVVPPSSATSAMLLGASAAGNLGRSALDRVRAKGPGGKAHRIDLPGQVFSRVHVDDIASGRSSARTFWRER